MSRFVFDELTKFWKNNEVKVDVVDSESYSASGQINLIILQKKCGINFFSNKNQDQNHKYERSK